MAAAAKRRTKKAKTVANVVDDVAGVSSGFAQSALRAAHLALTKAREAVRAADAQLQKRLKPKKRAVRKAAAKMKMKRPKTRRAKRKA